MSYDPDIKQSIEEILLRVNEVEVELKVYESFSGEPCIPAINELRYATRKLADILKITLSSDDLSAEDKKILRDNLANVSQYVINAKHDIVDASLAYMEGMISDTVREYGSQANVEEFPELPLLKKELFDVREMGIQSRIHRERRDAIYTDIIDNRLPDIMARFKLYEEKNSEIEYKGLKIIKKHESSLRVSQASLAVTIVIAIIGWWF